MTKRPCHLDMRMTHYDATLWSRVGGRGREHVFVQVPGGPRVTCATWLAAASFLHTS